MIYIGDILTERMNLVNVTIEELANLTFLETSYLKKILNNILSFDDIDFYDLTMISSILHCTPEYFISEEYRKRFTGRFSK